MQKKIVSRRVITFSKIRHLCKERICKKKKKIACLYNLLICIKITYTYICIPI